MAIDFVLSDSQQELQKNARDFAEQVLDPIVDKIDRSSDGWESFLAGREANGLALSDHMRAEQVKLDFPGDVGDAGLAGLAGQWPCVRPI